jgi:hypothetical protein
MDHCFVKVLTVFFPQPEKQASSSKNFLFHKAVSHISAERMQLLLCRSPIAVV